LHEGIQVARGSPFGCQQFQGDAIFREQMHEQLGMAHEFGILGQEMFRQVHEFGVLGREMLHHLLNVMRGAHGGAELLLRLEFRFSSEHILSGQSETRILKMLLLLVLIVTNRVRAFLDVEFSPNVNECRYSLVSVMLFLYPEKGILP
jgi:hypothetical protein